MNLQRREEIRSIAEFPNDMRWAQEMRRAVAELLAYIATLEQAAAERAIADGSRGPGVVPAAVVPESLLHDLAMAAWDEGADAGMVWDPDADPAKRGVVPCTPEEGIAKARDHFAKHGSGSPSSAFSRALQAIREHSRAIPADRVLGEGMVAVDSARLAALESIAAKIEALALGPDGRAWTPLHYREFARGELRAALRANQGGDAT